MFRLNFELLRSLAASLSAQLGLQGPDLGAKTSMLAWAGGETAAFQAPEGTIAMPLPNSSYQDPAIGTWSI